MLIVLVENKCGAYGASYTSWLNLLLFFRCSCFFSAADRNYCLPESSFDIDEVIDVPIDERRNAFDYISWKVRASKWNPKNLCCFPWQLQLVSGRMKIELNPIDPKISPLYLTFIQTSMIEIFWWYKEIHKTYLNFSFIWESFPWTNASMPGVNVSSKYSKKMKIRCQNRILRKDACVKYIFRATH